MKKSSITAYVVPVILSFQKLALNTFLLHSGNP